MAAAAGYFETPAEATRTEVAGELDVTPQAVSSTLRVAVRTRVRSALAFGPGEP